MTIIQLLVAAGFAVFFALEGDVCATVFFAIFAVATVWSVSGTRKRRRLSKLTKRSHKVSRRMSAPWSARHEWHIGEIKPDEREYLNVVGRAVVAVPWLLIGLFVAYDTMPRHWDEWPTWLALLFMVVFPLWILARTPRALRLMERSSNGLLVIDGPPGPVHDRFVATVQLPGLQPTGPAVASLLCVERTYRLMRTTSSSGGKGDAFRGSSGTSVGLRRSDEELWREDIELDEARLIQRDGILNVPIELTLPDDFVETTAIQEGAEGVVWKVEVKTETREGPIRMTFEVPVFSDAEGDCHQT